MQNRRVRVDHELCFAITDSDGGITDAASTSFRNLFFGAHGVLDSSKVDEGTLFVWEDFKRLDWTKGAEKLHKVAVGEAGVDVPDPE
jgi:hypothetical protein